MNISEKITRIWAEKETNKLKLENKQELQRKSIKLRYKYKRKETKRRITATKNCITAMQSVELFLKENMRRPFAYYNSPSKQFTKSNSRLFIGFPACRRPYVKKIFVECSIITICPAFYNIEILYLPSRFWHSIQMTGDWRHRRLDRSHHSRFVGERGSTAGQSLLCFSISYPIV